jgi:hypothetical protein
LIYYHASYSLVCFYFVLRYLGCDIETSISLQLDVTLTRVTRGFSLYIPHTWKIGCCKFVTHNDVILACMSAKSAPRLQLDTPCTSVLLVSKIKHQSFTFLYDCRIKCKLAEWTCNYFLLYILGYGTNLRQCH